MKPFNPKIIFANAGPQYEVQPWGKAFSYSAIGHSALIFSLLIMGFHHQKEIKTVITEIKFLERPMVIDVKKTKPSGPIKGDSEPTVKATKERRSFFRRRKTSLSNQRESLSEKTQTTKISTPRGKKGGKVVSRKPLSGPIIAIKNIGTVGKKRGSLVELGGNQLGQKPKNLLVPASSSGGSEEKIALDSIGLDDIRKKESSIGSPLVSQKVVRGSLPGRLKELAQATNSKKKATAEYLKANPLDKDMWGKSKGPFSMEGPLKYRKILKMELPPYPRWAEEKALESSVSIRLWVNPKGRVIDNMYLEKTTGYSELDHLAMEALRRFVFIPLPDDQPQEDEWGIATFRFELRK